MDPGLYTDQATNRATEPTPLVAPVALRRDQVYAELRRRVMMGEFGVQSRLVEERLAATFGVSRTPVRESLVRLLAEGLVVRHDGGYYVALPDLSRLRNLYELRITLEMRGLERSLESNVAPHDSMLLEPLRDQWRLMDQDEPEPNPEFVLVDEDFHITLLRSSGNDALTDTLESVNARIRAVRMYDFLTEDRIRRTVSEHLGIVELVLGRKIDDALVALQEHVDISKDVVEKRAARAITHMALHRGGES
jgi:DNA-binding GntR family transcriptional regulator